MLELFVILPPDVIDNDPRFTVPVNIRSKVPAEPILTNPPDTPPRLLAFEAVNIPAEIVEEPVYVFAFDNVKVPFPDLTRAPVPEIIPLNVWFVVPIESIPEFAILAE